VHVVAGDETEGEGAPAGAAKPAALPPRRIDWRGYALASLVVAAAACVDFAARPWIGVENVDLVFLTAIVGIAATFGLGPSLFASVAASLLYNFLFLPPLYAFTIAAPTNVVAFVLFIAMAAIVSNVAARVRTQALVATSRARTTEQLYAFSRKLAGVGTLDDVLWVTAYQTAAMLKVRVVLLLPEGDSIAVKAGYPPEDTLEPAELAAAKWAWQNDRPAGHGSDTLPGTRRLFLPMRTGRGPIGVVGIDRDKPGALLAPDERRLLDALIDQGALAIERVALVEDMARVKRTAETERLRSAMLTSLSHDLRTPLAAILGAAGALRDMPAKLGEAEKADLLATIIEEAERLNRFIANLLDMTRLEAGAIAPNTQPHELSEIVGTTLRRADRILGRHRVALDVPADLPLLDVDAVLFEQVLFNLLDNAAKYAPAGTEIAIRGRRDGEAVAIQVLDEGEGIPAADLEQIFSKFYRTRKFDRVRAGTGLGLAISRGFIEAMRGTIVAANRSDRSGAVFTIRLPIATRPTHLATAA
jgi:two-component system sensor histidine kinase KdpD